MRNPTGHYLLATMVAAGAAWLCLPANGDDPADRQDDSTRTCALTAQRMLKSCLFDVGAELQKTLAACINLPEGGRAACAEEARAARAEEVELCNESLDARQGVCELLDENRYRDPLAAQGAVFVSPDQIGAGGYAPNPYLSLVEGRTNVFHAGEDGTELVVVTVTSETRTILDVECRVAVDISVEVSNDEGTVEYEPIEVTDDWYAQDSVGNVYYCGELSRNYEDGVLRDLEGSFEAGRDYAKGGYLVKATPAVGTAHRQEYSLGEAEDVVEYVDLNATPVEAEGGENAKFPCGGKCLKTLEHNPNEPAVVEFKYYLPKVGFVLATAMEDDEFVEREELVCSGDSLEILDRAECGIEDSKALREQLCTLAPETFCAEHAGD